MNRNRALWIAQGLLAVFFLFVGVSKVDHLPEMLATLFPLPADFIRFIGICESARRPGPGAAAGAQDPP